MDDFSKLPRHARRKIQAESRKLMSDLGVKPMVDERTGEVVYDFNAACKALGLNPDEERRRAEMGGFLSTAPAHRIKPLQ